MTNVSFTILARFLEGVFVNSYPGSYLGNLWTSSILVSMQLNLDWRLRWFIDDTGLSIDNILRGLVFPWVICGGIHCAETYGRYAHTGCWSSEVGLCIISLKCSLLWIQDHTFTSALKALACWFEHQQSHLYTGCSIMIFSLHSCVKWGDLIKVSQKVC